MKVRILGKEEFSVPRERKGERWRKVRRAVLALERRMSRDELPAPGMVWG